MAGLGRTVLLQAVILMASEVCKNLKFVALGGGSVVGHTGRAIDHLS
jgi:hypothetical protein